MSYERKRALGDLLVIIYYTLDRYPSSLCFKCVRLPDRTVRSRSVLLTEITGYELRPQVVTASDVVPRVRTPLRKSCHQVFASLFVEPTRLHENNICKERTDMSAALQYRSPAALSFYATRFHED